MPPRDLILRTSEFALAVTRFLRTLPKTDDAQDAARQLRRAANSARSNYRAARKGRTRKEFEAKLGIAREEADECACSPNPANWRRSWSPRWRRQFETRVVL